MARKKATTPAAITRAETQAKVLQYRQLGIDYRTIADKLDISKSTAQRMAAEAIAEITREPAQLVVDIELARLDQLLSVVYRDALQGDLKALGAVMKIMERRAKYLNLDAAVAPDTSGEARAALADLMGAIRSNSYDEAEMAFSAIAPGADPTSVTGQPAA
ncbi:hypothetical protein ACWEQ4_01200 [Rhodococcus sp. NPDC003994]